MRMLTSVAFATVILAVGFVLLRPRVARADLLKQDQFAPTFSTQMVQGDQITPISLSDLRGRTVILYFYPKDDTPGCTKEACAFRDGFSRFQAAGLVVLGCSVDSSDSHRQFIQKYNIPFPLLIDTDKKIATQYGAANGIPILGLDRRITYVISDDGRIAHVYPNVDPAQQATQILSDLRIPEHPEAAPPAAAATPKAEPEDTENPE